MSDRDGAWRADAKIAAGVDSDLNTHPLNCDSTGTLEVVGIVSIIPAVTIPVSITNIPNTTQNDTFSSVSTGTVVNASAKPPRSFSLQVTGVGGIPNEWNVVLEGSLNGTDWTTLLTSSGALISFPIHYDNSANLGDTSSTPYTTAPFTISGDNIALFLCLCFNSPAAPAVNYGGLPMTLIASVNNGVPISVYVLYNAPAGSDVFNITGSGSATRMFASSYNGVLMQDAFVTDTTNLGNAPVVIPITTVVVNEWLVALANGSNPWHSDGTVRVASSGEYGSIADKGPIILAGPTSISIEQDGQGPSYQNSVVVVALEPFLQTAPQNGQVFSSGAVSTPVSFFRTRVVSLNLGPASAISVHVLGV